MKNKQLLLWKGELFKGLLVIRNHDLHAGFGALLLYALNGIRKAESINAIPVIDFNKNNCPYFHDETKGKYVWEYFFEKIGPYTYEEVKYWLAEGLISDQEVHFIDSSEAARTHHHDPERLATFWAWQEPEDKVKWLKEKRALGRRYIREYVQPKAQIKEKVDRFVTSEFNSPLIIGLHIRGTDFAYAKPTPIEAYFNEIDRLVDNSKESNYQVYVATDQQQYLEAFKHRYTGKVLHLDALRSNNHIAPFRFEKTSGYQKGEEVLMDMLLLSKCHYLIKAAAATGELALWFCNHQNFTDFALKSEFNRKRYDKLESTYTQFNIGYKKKFALTYHRAMQRIVRRIISSRIGLVLYRKFGLVRKLLKH